MKQNIQNELKQFKEFKKNFKFNQKKIIIKDNNLYCDGELLQEGEEKPLGETDKWINVGYKLKGPYSKVLSNLFPYEFEFRNKKFNSIESFFQGLKFKDKDIQEYVFKYSGLDANNIKVATDYNWKETGFLYWQGNKIDRYSEEYNDLVDELYISAIQNPLYRNVLKSIDKDIIHSIGITNKEETVFTRYEFEYMLNSLVVFLKNK